MEFIISRSSKWDNSRPCWEAVPKTISYKWNGETREDTVWIVQFANLKELMRFRNKYGSLIIGRKTFGLMDDELITYDTIEIYDNYRE